KGGSEPPSRSGVIYRVTDTVLKLVILYVVSYKNTNVLPQKKSLMFRLFLGCIASGDYLTPCISFFSKGFSNITIKPATVGTIVNIKKKVESEYCSVILSICPPRSAANLFPIAIAKYHIPNIKAIIRAGTNFDT